MKENRMREWKSEPELKEIAQGIAARQLTVCVDGGGEVKREPTKKQRDLAYRIAYGALLGLNWGESTRSNPVSEQAIIDATEFQYDLLLSATLKDGESVNGYLGIYCPLKDVLRNWKTA